MYSIGNSSLLGLPRELINCPQWCIAGTDKSPLIETSDGKLIRAKVNAPPWMSFDQAYRAGNSNNLPIGFVLTQADPFVCIDLDVKDSQSIDKDGNYFPVDKFTTDEELSRYTSIVNFFNSYSEISQSGKGVHIWVKGSLAKGYRREGVEVYPYDRFIICTGLHFSQIEYRNYDGLVAAYIEQENPKPITFDQEKLNTLVKQLQPLDIEVVEDIYYKEPSEIVPDSEIYRLAMSAENSLKFYDLCNGDWQKYNYPSQSEADLSLMSMFAFYSNSNEQCKRLFRQTRLGQRKKAVVDDRYLNLTLTGIRKRQFRDNQQKQIINQQADLLLKSIHESKTNPDIKIEDVLRRSEPYRNTAYDIRGPIEFPPGVVGQVAEFIYGASNRPVREVAIVSAIGFFAGILGKVFNVSGSGLNLYLTLIARSGVGKEGMHNGIEYLLNKIQNAIPGVHEFVEFAQFVSGPALIKGCAKKTSFLNVCGEWGRKLKALSDDKGTGPSHQVRSVMTELFSKSGSNSMVGGLKYSSDDNSVGSISGVAYSMIGDTTPGNFYESLTPSMMEDGFLSRFILIEHTGERPPGNTNRNIIPNDQLTERLCSIVTQALTLTGRHTFTNIQFTESAYNKFNSFDLECDGLINGTTNESFRQMWNRACLKALRLAGILAAADNHIAPVINDLHADWAIYLIKRSNRIMSVHLQEGNIGTHDDARERKLLAIIKEFLATRPSPGYKVPDMLYEARIIPRRYLSMKVCNVSSFYNHKNGTRFALDQAINSLINDGFLSEIDKVESVTKFGAYHGKCYRILDLK